MVRVKRRPCCSNKMAQFQPQSHLIQHLNRSMTKAVRLRPARFKLGKRLDFKPPIKLYNKRRLSINLNHLQHSAASHHQRKCKRKQRQTQLNLKHQMLPMTTAAAAAKITTTSGNQSAISAQEAHRRPMTGGGQMFRAPTRRGVATTKTVIGLAINVLLLTLAIGTRPSNCDSVQGSGAAGAKLWSPPPLPKVSNQIIEAHGQQQQRRSDGPADGLVPSFRSLSLSRPSKFDSGNEKLIEEPARIHTRSSSAAASSNKQVKTLDDIMSQHLGLGSRTSVSSSTTTTLNGKSHKQAARPPASSKAEQDLRQIMMLHEQAGSSHAQTTVNKQPSGQAASGEKHALAKFNPLKLLKSNENVGLNQTTSSLVKLAATWPPLADVKTGGQALASVLSYLNPMVTATNNVPRNSHLMSANPHNSSATTNPFTPRMSAKTFLVGPLLGLGQMFVSPPDGSGGSQKTVNKYNMPVGGAGGSTAESQASYVLSNAINQPQGYSSSLKGLIRNRVKPGGSGETSQEQDLVAEASAPVPTKSSITQKLPPASSGSWIKNGANHLAQSYFQDSFRDLLTLTQLPILSGGPISTAPSELEPGGKKHAANKLSSSGQQQVGTSSGSNANKTQALDDIFRYAYILANLGVRRKRDPLKALGPSPSAPSSLMLASGGGGGGGGNKSPLFSLRNSLLSTSGHQRPPSASQANSLVRLPATLVNLNALLGGKKIKPRGVMWDMATDPSLAVTVFHLLERASVALPLGFLLMPLVHMIRNPFNGLNLGRIIPARASHRSVDYEELAKRIDMVDKILSRALRSTHRESSSALSFIKR